MTHDPTQLPAALPVPVDDGACDHLPGSVLPRVALACTDGTKHDLRRLCEPPTVLFAYPRTGVPGRPPARGFGGEGWDEIPGARGCTPQSCSFRDVHADFAALGVRVLGLSTVTTEHQREFKARLHVPYEFLSDSELALTHGLRLPTFEFPRETGMATTTLLRRMAWYCSHGAIRKVWYPVFPPDRNAAFVLAWLKEHRP